MYKAMKQQPSRRLLVVFAGAFLVICGFAAYYFWPRVPWNEEQQAMLRSLWIGGLSPLAPDPSNRYGDDQAAAILGEKLFFDTRFSGNGEVSCATCHLPELGFQDGTPLAQGIGTTNRRTMPIAGTAYSPWLFWDGRKDSQWAQALGPLENPVEHGGNRTYYAHLIARYYRDEYEAIFGPLPDLSHLPVQAGPVDDAAVRAALEALSPDDREAVTRIYVNVGKAIAAYERQLMPGASRFDAYAEAVIEEDYERAATILSTDEVAGLELFIGQASCTQCHNGPLFTNNDFHNTGVPAVATLPEDMGRAQGAQDVLADEFNCLSAYSDAAARQCVELKHLNSDGHNLIRQFKPPSLRNVVEREPYMHAGQFATLEEVLAHYNAAPAAPAGHSELEPLDLSQEEISQLIAFLNTLTGAINVNTQGPAGSNATATTQ